MISVSNSQVVRPEWARVPIRLDPATLDRRQAFDRMDGEELVSYRIDRRGAVVRRALAQSGIPVSVALPPHAFAGIAARAMEDGEGNVTVTLELHHADAKFSVPLLVASDLFDVAADWRAWSELFSLPMLMIEADGTVTPLEETLGKVKASAPSARRRAALKNRRPRFLARRKPGGLGVRLVVRGDELIARN